MHEHCVVISLLPGRGESARAFMRELVDGRRAEQERSERRVGIRAARWFLGTAAQGELLIGMIDSGDLARAAGLLSVSMEPHDLWFKRRLAALTGLDLNEASSLPLAEQFIADPTPETGGGRQATAPLVAQAGTAEG